MGRASLGGISACHLKALRDQQRLQLYLSKKMPARSSILWQSFEIEVYISWSFLWQKESCSLDCVGIDRVHILSQLFAVKCPDGSCFSHAHFQNLRRQPVSVFNAVTEIGKFILVVASSSSPLLVCGFCVLHPRLRAISILVLRKAKVKLSLIVSKY